MELSIALDGAAAKECASELKDWLHQKRLRGVERLQQARRPPAAGEQGPEPLALLTVVLAAPAVVELVRSIHGWIETTRRDVTITVTRKNGEQEHTIKLHARNPDSVAEVTAAAEQLLDE